MERGVLKIFLKGEESKKGGLFEKGRDKCPLRTMHLALQLFLHQDVVPYHVMTFKTTLIKGRLNDVVILLLKRGCNEDVRTTLLYC